MARMVKILSDFCRRRVFNRKVMTTESQTLLAEYARNGSEPAFRELVARYLDLVYSTALRSVGGDTHLAEDVAQIVFVNLARKARWLPSDVLLGGWLHRCRRERGLRPLLDRLDRPDKDSRWVVPAQPRCHDQVTLRDNGVRRQQVE
jgi:DNA-directed RNA polymerase specialized sigma24 family protein